MLCEFDALAKSRKIVKNSFSSLNSFPTILSFDLVTQTLTLMKKIRTKWGDFNGTDADDSDSPNWGFLNMKRLGHIALGIAKEELRYLPIRGIEDVIDVLGKEKDWDRGQVKSVFCLNPRMTAINSNESRRAVLSCGFVYHIYKYTVQGGSSYSVCLFVGQHSNERF